MDTLIPLYNTEDIPGKKLELLGLVKGSMIQSKHLGRDIGNVLKSIVGGELRGYGEMLNEARALATTGSGKLAVLASSGPAALAAAVAATNPLAVLTATLCGAEIVNLHLVYLLLACRWVHHRCRPLAAG